MNTEKTFADRLKELRNIRNYTQEELGKITNISVQSIRRYEQGRLNEEPSAYNLLQLAKALDVTPEYLLIQKAQVLITAANVKLGEIQAIDYSWGEIDFVTKPMNEMRLMEFTECEMSAPAVYDIDIEADDIDVTDTVTVVWEIA